MGRARGLEKRIGEERGEKKGRREEGEERRRGGEDRRGQDRGEGEGGEEGNQCCYILSDFVPYSFDHASHVASQDNRKFGNKETNLRHLPVDGVDSSSDNLQRGKGVRKEEREEVCIGTRVRDETPQPNLCQRLFAAVTS